MRRSTSWQRAAARGARECPRGIRTYHWPDFLAQPSRYVNRAIGLQGTVTKAEKPEPGLSKVDAILTDTTVVIAVFGDNPIAGQLAQGTTMRVFFTLNALDERPAFTPGNQNVFAVTQRVLWIGRPDHFQILPAPSPPQTGA